MFSLAILLQTAMPTGAASEPAREPIGKILSYVRSNQDGTEREDIHVFRRDAVTLEVVKTRDRCKNAAYVIATLDPVTWEARTLSGGRLLPDARREAFAALTDDPQTNRLEAEVDLPQGKISTSVPITARPWHQYDFDLASLSVATEHLKEPEKGFQFGLAMVWADPAQPDKFLRFLGRASATFIGEHSEAQYAARSFRVDGPAFGSAGGGILNLDKAQGHIVSARFGLPNHLEYKDFQLVLVNVTSGVKAWDSILRAHWDGCPAP